MLRVDVEGRKLEIDWEHSITQRWTECYITDLGSLRGSASGIALKHPSDPFVKETGRKVSLASALRQIFPSDPISRAVVWQAYFARKGKV